MLPVHPFGCLSTYLLLLEWHCNSWWLALSSICTVCLKEPSSSWIQTVSGPWKINKTPACCWFQSFFSWQRISLAMFTRMYTCSLTTYLNVPFFKSWVKSNSTILRLRLNTKLPENDTTPDLYLLPMLSTKKHFKISPPIHTQYKESSTPVLKSDVHKKKSNQCLKTRSQNKLYTPKHRTARDQRTLSTSFQLLKSLLEISIPKLYDWTQLCYKRIWKVECGIMMSGIHPLFHKHIQVFPRHNGDWAEKLK